MKLYVTLTSPYARLARMMVLEKGLAHRVEIIPVQTRTPGSPYYGVTWERRDAQEVHYKGLFDDRGRLMAIICHNTDLGDGWEREGDNELYFREFSEKKAYPMGINIVFYAMTH